MNEEIAVKTHLIVTDIHEEYHIKWCGKIANTTPLIENGKPIFVIIGKKGRIELNTANMIKIEDCAKKLTQPKGREAVTIDQSFIYLKEVSGNEALMAVLTHRHIKTYAPMYDKIGYR